MAVVCAPNGFVRLVIVGADVCDCSLVFWLSKATTESGCRTHGSILWMGQHLASSVFSEGWAALHEHAVPCHAHQINLLELAVSQLSVWCLPRLCRNCEIGPPGGNPLNRDVLVRCMWPGEGVNSASSYAIILDSPLKPVTLLKNFFPGSLV